MCNLNLITLQCSCFFWYTQGASKSRPLSNFAVFFQKIHQFITDGDKSDPADIWIRIRINPEIRIRIPDNFRLRLDTLAEFCAL